MNNDPAKSNSKNAGFMMVNNFQIKIAHFMNLLVFLLVAIDSTTFGCSTQENSFQRAKIRQKNSGDPCLEKYGDMQVTRLDYETSTHC